VDGALDVSWTPDFWGKIRNEVRAEQYAAQASAADLELEKLTEQASLAQYYFEVRGQDMLQQILDHTVAADQKALDATQGGTTPVWVTTSRLLRPRRLCSLRKVRLSMWGSLARSTSMPSRCW